MRSWVNKLLNLSKISTPIQIVIRSKRSHMIARKVSRVLPPLVSSLYQNQAAIQVIRKRPILSKPAKSRWFLPKFWNLKSLLKIWHQDSGWKKFAKITNPQLSPISSKFLRMMPSKNSLKLVIHNEKLNADFKQSNRGLSTQYKIVWIILKINVNL